MRDLFLRKTLFKPSPAGALGSYLVLFIWTIVVLFPLYWLVVTSLKVPIQVHEGPFYIPFVDFKPTLEPWKYILLGDLSNDTLRTYYNTVIVAPISALLALVIGSASAYALVRFSPGDISPNTPSSIFTTVKLDQMYALDHALYLSNQQKIGDKLILDYGVRLSIFQNIGKGQVYLYDDPSDNINIERTDTLHYDGWENIKTYVNLEPRFAARYLLPGNQSLKVSYNRMVQNTHLISAGTVPVPFNTWNPSGYYLGPQVADQFAVGYFRNFRNNKYEFSAEAYYKDIDDVTDFADNADIFFNPDLSTEFRQGAAWGYGLELMITKRSGKLTGAIGYTLSKAMRKIPGVNLDREFVANYDRRNVVNVQAAYDMSARWSFGATFTFSTGRPTTLPTGKFEYQNYQPDLISERNGYRLPAFHRLDLSATLTPRKRKPGRWHGQWVFSVYNAYNRKNPFTIYTRVTQNDDGDVVGDGNTKEARMVYLFPILPSVTYNFKF
jgi:hypothetical protein